MMNTPPQLYHALATAHGRDLQREADLRRRRRARRHADHPPTSPAVRRSRLAVLATLLASLVWPTSAVQGAGRVGPHGTVWVGNRGFPAVAAFDAATGAHLHTVALEAPASDVAVVRVPERSRNGPVFGERVFVGEENADQITVIDGETAVVVTRIDTASHPHHLEASDDGRWVTYGAFGTNVVGLIDTRRLALVGQWPASKDPAARSHASIVSDDGRTLYVANDITNEITAVDIRSGRLRYSIPVHHAHELVLADDQRTLYVSARGADLIHIVDLPTRSVTESIPVGPLPDTLELADHDRLLTVGLRGTPAQLATVETAAPHRVAYLTVAPRGTIAGHQWTSPNGHWTVIAYEGATAGIAVIDHRHNSIATIDYPGGGRPHGLDVITQPRGR